MTHSVIICLWTHWTWSSSFFDSHVVTLFDLSQRNIGITCEITGESLKRTTHKVAHIHIHTSTRVQHNNSQMVDRNSPVTTLSLSLSLFSKCLSDQSWTHVHQSITGETHKVGPLWCLPGAGRTCFPREKERQKRRHFNEVKVRWI